MKAGTLRHRVTLQQLIKTRDQIGGEVESWQDVATVWASVEPLKGREFFTAQQVNAEVTGRVRLRYRAGISPTMRFLYGARVLNIIGPPINVDERNRELEVMVREVVA